MYEEKNQRYGEVRKCVHCGAIIEGLQAKCPACGTEFTGVAANATQMALFEVLRDPKLKDAQKAKLIEAFPIPNTKEDLFEFLASLQAKIDLPRTYADQLVSRFQRKKRRDKEINKAYLIKYQECLNKVAVLFPKDSTFTPYFDFISKGKRIKRNATIVRIIAILVLLSFIISLLIPDYTLTDPKLCEQAIVEAIAHGKTDKAKRIAYNFEKGIKSKWHVMLIQGYLDEGDINKALAEKEVAYAQRLTSADKEAIQQAFYKVYMKNGDYYEAGKYAVVIEDGFSLTNTQYAAYYAYLSECVDIMCQKGQKEEARQFVNKQVNFYDAHASYYVPKQWKMDTVKSKLLNQINNN